MDSSKFKEIEYIKKGEIAIIKFNRPEKRNCIGPQTHTELVTAWGDFKMDDKLKVAILTGAGDQAFCAGGDLSAGPQLIDLSDAEIKLHREGKKDGIIGPSRWTDIYKPIIAAVNGVAYAGGLEWACFADIRIVEAHATFGVTCRRWNIGLGDGGTQRLPRIVGMGNALELIITGKVIDAKEAYRIGLANTLVEKGKSLEKAMEVARFICTLPQAAMRTDKEAAVRGFGLPLEEGLKIEAGLFYDSISDPTTQEGLRRFSERDHPDLDADQTSVTPGIA